MSVMKKKTPKLVVDNKLPDTDLEEQFSYEEFKLIAEQMLDIHGRYPEIDALIDRARKNKDFAMLMTGIEIGCRYGEWRDHLAEQEREKLRVVKKKRDP
jgi:hypothetical protein